MRIGLDIVFDTVVFICVAVFYILFAYIVLVTLIFINFWYHTGNKKFTWLLLVNKRFYINKKKNEEFLLENRKNQIKELKEATSISEIREYLNEGELLCSWYMTEQQVANYYRNVTMPNKMQKLNEEIQESLARVSRIKKKIELVVKTAESFRANNNTKN